MVDDADASEVVGKTTLQPPEVRRFARSVESTTSSSTIRIERSFSGRSTIGPGTGGTRADMRHRLIYRFPPNKRFIFGTDRPYRRCAVDRCPRTFRPRHQRYR